MLGGFEVTKADRLAEVLDDFLGVSTEAEAAAVVSSDGLPMASALPPHVEEDRLAAMSAALLTLGERAAEGLGRGELGQVFIEGKDGYVVLMAAGPHAVLVAITSRRAKVGLVLFEMRRAAGEISSVMNESVPAEMDMQDMPEPPEPPMRAPEPVPAAETESSMPSWQ
jgi:uncharacterized protein